MSAPGTWASDSPAAAGPLVEMTGPDFVRWTWAACAECGAPADFEVTGRFGDESVGACRVHLMSVYRDAGGTLPGLARNPAFDEMPAWTTRGDVEAFGRSGDVERDGVPHNLFAHPLLVLCPRLGRWLHERTEPTVPTWGARWRGRFDRTVS